MNPTERTTFELFQGLKKAHGALSSALEAMREARKVLQGEEHSAVLKKLDEAIRQGEKARQ
jgi:hypothetical protein